MPDRPKKSWRELDQQRDKARTTDASGGAPRKQAEEDRQSKQHRAALDALFAKGAVAELAEKMGLIKTTSQSRPEPAKTEAAAPVEEPKPAAPPVENPKLVARKKLIEAVGRPEITRAFDKYQKSFGMPDDWELLELGLEHQKEEAQTEVLTAIAALLEKKGAPRRSRGLASKLRFLEETSEEAEIRSAAAALRSKLG